MRWSHRFDRSSTQDVVYPNIMLYCITHRSWEVLFQISNFLHVHFPSHGNQHFLNMNNEMNELNFWSEHRYVLRLLQSFVTEGNALFSSTISILLYMYSARHLWEELGLLPSIKLIFEGENTFLTQIIQALHP